MRIYNIMKYYKVSFALSGAIILLGLIMLVLNGFNLGIDFTGGTMLQIEIGKEVSVDEITALIEEFDLSPEIIHSGLEKSEVIIKTKASLDSAQRDEIFEKFKTTYSLEDSAFKSSEQFGPSMGKEIRNRAFIAILLASAMMLVYITVRFEIVFGVAAIIALLHDVLILVAIYAIFGITVNSTFIAAILTVIGYSINDTIVVFDRIRENVKREKTKDHIEIVNISVTQTMTRTINTGMATLFVIVTLFILGATSIKEFAFPLFIGIVVGTYSSIFIASPAWAFARNYIGNRGNYASK